MIDWLRRHRRKVAVGAAVVLAGPFAWYVPIMPYYPQCEPFRHVKVNIDDAMSDEYRYVLLVFFRDFGIRYWRIANRVFVPFYTWFTGHATDDDSGLELDVPNAQIHAVRYLAQESHLRSRDGEILENFGNSLEGMVIAGKVYRVPDHVKALVGRPGAIVDSDRCELLYAVVTGRPATDEMLKRWYTPAKKMVF